MKWKPKAGVNDVMNAPTMLEETGKVIAVDGAYAVIEMQQRSACGHCNQSDQCGTSMVTGLFSARRQRLHLINHLNLSVGDAVVVGINETVLLTAALMAYLLPVLMMLLFALLATASGLGDGGSVALSILGLFAGLGAGKYIMGRQHAHSREIVLLRNANTSVIRFTEQNI